MSVEEKNDAIKEEVEAQEKEESLEDVVMQELMGADADEAETEEVSEESPAPETNIPEWAGEVDLADEVTRKAVEWFAGGDKDPMFKKPISELPEEVANKFKSVQSVYDKHQAAQNPAKEVDPQSEWVQAKIKQLMEEDAKHREAQPQTVETTEDNKEKELLNKIERLKESGEIEGALAVMEELQRVRYNKIEESLDKKVQSLVAEKTKQAIQTETEQQRLHRIQQESNALRQQEGQRYEKYLAQGADGLCTIERLMIHGDPITGKKYNSPTDAYKYCLQQERGNGNTIVAPSAQPPAGAVEGNVPSVSDEDLKNLSTKEFLMKHCLDDFKKIAGDLH